MVRSYARNGIRLFFPLQLEETETLETYYFPTQLASSFGLYSLRPRKRMLRRFHDLDMIVLKINSFHRQRRKNNRILAIPLSILKVLRESNTQHLDRHLVYGTVTVLKYIYGSMNWPRAFYINLTSTLQSFSGCAFYYVEPGPTGQTLHRLAFIDLPGQFTLTGDKSCTLLTFSELKHQFKQNMEKRAKKAQHRGTIRRRRPNTQRHAHCRDVGQRDQRHPHHQPYAGVHRNTRYQQF